MGNTSTRMEREMGRTRSTKKRSNLMGSLAQQKAALRETGQEKLREQPDDVQAKFWDDVAKYQGNVTRGRAVAATLLPGVGLGAASGIIGAGEFLASAEEGNLDRATPNAMKEAALTYVGGKVIEKLAGMTIKAYKKFVDSLVAQDKAVTDAEMNLLKEMLKYKQAHGGRIPAELQADLTDKLASMASNTGSGNAGTGGALVSTVDKLATDSRAAAPATALAKQAGRTTVNLDELIKANDPNVLQWGKNVNHLLEWVPPKSSFPGTPRNSARPVFSEADTNEYLDDIAARFGDKARDQVEALLQNENFNGFFYPEGFAEKAAGYAKKKSLYERITEPNKIVLGGSPGMASEGTLYRSTAAPHDLDFTANAANASLKPVSELTREEQIERLMDNASLEASPIFAKLREQVPELKNAKFRYAKQDYEFDWAPDGTYDKELRYAPDVFTIPMAQPSASADGRMTRLVTVRIDGEPVDLFIQDAQLAVSHTNPRLGSASSAMEAKKAYTSHGKPREKDLPDLTGFKEYDEDNLMIDPFTGQSQFSSMMFPEKTYITEKGFPVVAEMPLRPGHDLKSLVIMNDRGEFLQLDNPRPVLNWYTDVHQLDPKKIHTMYTVPGSTADASTHPLVAISGSEGQTPYGIESPSIGIYPATDLETLVDDMFVPREGNWVTESNGSFKDVLIFPRAAVDPRYNPKAALWPEDAWTDTVFHAKNGSTIDEVRENARRWQETSRGKTRSPYGSPRRDNFPEINSAYRQVLYDANPWSNYAGSPKLKVYEGYGEGKARGINPTDDYIKIPGSLLRDDPEKARAILLSVLERTRFDAKGGDTYAGREGSFGKKVPSSPPPATGAQKGGNVGTKKAAVAKKTPVAPATAPAPVPAPAPAPAPAASQKLINFLKKHEKLETSPYSDVGGYAIGYGAHMIKGEKVTAATKAITEQDADDQLAIDIAERQGRLAAMIPGWEYFDQDMKDALTEVSFGRDDVLTEKKSPNLHRRLKAAAALTDPTQRIRGLADVLYDEIPTYVKAGGQKLQGLVDRRQDNIDTFLPSTARRRRAEAAKQVVAPAAQGEAVVVPVTELPAGTAGAQEGGDTAAPEPEAPVQEAPVAEAPQEGGPRIVINPTTFQNKKDALCVAFNEGFRIIMETSGFDPVSEPTEKQRKFFADTAYNDDEVQLRRTILARICTFDTSVTDPTAEQLQESVEFLDSVLEMGAPQNDFEQQAVQKLRDAVAGLAGEQPDQGTGGPTEEPVPEEVPPEEVPPEEVPPEEVPPEAEP